jgi:hypothetical protein
LGFHERIQNIGREFLNSEDAHEIVREVMRDALGHADIRQLILLALTEGFPEHHVKSELEQKTSEIKALFTRELEVFKGELKSDLDTLRFKLLGEANEAREEAIAVFDGMLRTRRAAAIRGARQDADDVLTSIQTESTKQVDELRSRFSREMERRTESSLREFAEWIDREFARKERELQSKLDRQVRRQAEPFIREAVRRLFGEILGDDVAARMDDARIVGMEQGRSEGYQQGQDAGRREGFEEGRRSGYHEGRSEGIPKATRKAIRRAIQKGTVLAFGKDRTDQRSRSRDPAS